MRSSQFVAGMFALVVVVGIPQAALAQNEDTLEILSWFECNKQSGECETPDTLEESSPPEDDSDDDGEKNEDDNCPLVPNQNQSDIDGDGVGDSCDNCPNHSNSLQEDMDLDGVGNICDVDADNDQVMEDIYNQAADDVADAGSGQTGSDYDNCLLIYNPKQNDLDGDGYGDACDDDIDQDGTPNFEDWCPYGDSIQGPQVCAGDIDGDGVADFDLTGTAVTLLDNCMATPNANQADMDGDGIGDVCDLDIDGDGISNYEDNCYRCAHEVASLWDCNQFTDNPNPDQEDFDRDGIGADCDDSFCYVVLALTGNIEAEEGENGTGGGKDCFDPSEPFNVATPNSVDVRFGEVVRLRLFANRVNSALQYEWRITDSPVSNAGEIRNPDGATGYSTPFEYQYTSGNEPILYPYANGTYEVAVKVRQVFEDAITGEVGLEDEARAVIIVSGGNSDYVSDCECTVVGAGHQRTGSGLMILAGFVLFCIVLRRRA